MLGELDGPILGKAEGNRDGKWPEGKEGLIVGDHEGLVVEQLGQLGGDIVGGGTLLGFTVVGRNPDCEGFSDGM